MSSTGASFSRRRPGSPWMPMPDLDLVVGQVERRRARGGHDARGKGQAHRLPGRVDPFGRRRHVGQRGTGLRMRAGDLLEQHGHADAPSAGRVQRVLDRHVVVGDDRGDLDVAGHELRGHLEVEHVAGVVLDDVQDTGPAVDRPRGGLHLVGDRRGEHVAGSGRVEHALPDEPAVERLVPGSTARDEGDLALDRTAGAEHEVVRRVDLDVVRMRGAEATQALGDDVLDRVDELLHPAGCIRRHGFLLGSRGRWVEVVDGQAASTAGVSGMPATTGASRPMNW